MPKGRRERVLSYVLSHRQVAGEYKRQSKHVSMLPSVEVVERQRLAGRLDRGLDGGQHRPLPPRRGDAARCGCSLALHQ
jgi:hypothetical protein